MKKVCKQCKRIYEGTHCPECKSSSYSDSFKGRVIVLKPEQSEIAKKLKIKGKGPYAIKV